MTIMKLTYIRKVSEQYDNWTKCDIANLKKGDIFYVMEGDLEGPFLTAQSDATLKPSKNDDSKLIWHIDTLVMSDENFS